MNPQLETLKNWKGWSDGEVRRLAELVDKEHTDLLERLQKAEQQLKEAVELLNQTISPPGNSVKVTWPERDAFLASQKDAK